MEHKRVHWKTQDAQENLDPPIQNHKQQRVMSTFFYCVSTCNKYVCISPERRKRNEIRATTASNGL